MRSQPSLTLLCADSDFRVFRSVLTDQIYGRGDSGDVDLDIDVAASGIRVRAQLVGVLYQVLSDLARDSRQADIEARCESVGAMRRSKVHFGVDGHVTSPSYSRHSRDSLTG